MVVKVCSLPYPLVVSYITAITNKAKQICVFSLNCGFFTRINEAIKGEFVKMIGRFIHFCQTLLGYFCFSMRNLQVLATVEL